MAYSCVEVWFEIGHEASVRTKRTPEGFTHDWEVFVRGVDNADIHYFVEKVVFYLHETFPKPKRVVKEPPYSIKESGYAGFNLPIEVYFKNKDEPKKVQYNYDLQLQQSGPPISKIKREKYTFSNPSEDFRRKLIRGGGVGVLGSEAVGNSVSSEKNISEEGIPSIQPSVKHSSLSVAGKPKLSSESTKKAKVKDTKLEDIKPSNSFADLFGPPIKTAKVSPDPKKPQSKVSPVSKDSKSLDKTDNVDKHYSGIKSKHIPQKEIKKDNVSRDEKGEKKDKNKERERSKEKNSSSSSKHSTSPPKLAKEEAKKAPASEHKERVDAKNSDVKSDRKKEKKAKEEKVKKDKHKDVERGVTSERGEKSEKHAKENKEKEVKKSPKPVGKETEKVREKEKHRDSEKDKLRHKHKKKEKEKYKKVKDENKEKSKKTEPKTEEKENGNTTSEHRGEKRKRSESRSLSPSPRPSPVTPISPEKPPDRPPPIVKDKPAKNPLSQLFAELEDSFNSDSNSSPLSGDEDVIEFPKPKEKIFSPPEVKPEVIKEPPRVEEKVKEPPPETPEVSVENTKPSKQKQSSHRDKSSQSSTGSKSKSKEKSTRKKERDSGELTSEDTTEKKRKKRSKRGKEAEDETEERRKESGETAVSAGRQAVDNSSNYKHKFSKEYLSELLDLQKKIMTINDVEELQKVVHVLTQSGKYEINSKTFDVDLCALDKSTVKKLQEFFSAS